MSVHVFQGDCLEIMPRIPNQSIDMILCDLPYGTTACKWDVIIPFEPLWEQYKRIIKPRGAIVLTASQPFTSKLVMSNLKMFRYEWVWDKKHHSNFAIANYAPLKVHENICVFSLLPCRYFPIKTPGAKNHSQGKSFRRKGGSFVGDTLSICVPQDQSGMKYPKSIIEVEKHSSGCGLHPTQKPVALFEYLIRTYTQPGELVLDNCAGSGTTGVACLKTGRDCIMIEKEEKYVEIIKRRIQEANQ